MLEQAEVEEARRAGEAAAEEALAKAEAEKERTAAAAKRLEALAKQQAKEDGRRDARSARAARSACERARAKSFERRTSASPEEVSEVESSSTPPITRRGRRPDAAGGPTAAEEEDEEEDEEEESEEERGGGGGVERVAVEEVAPQPIETAKAMRERYAKTILQQDAEHKAFERQVKEAREEYGIEPDKGTTASSAAAPRRAAVLVSDLP